MRKTSTKTKARWDTKNETKTTTDTKTETNTNTGTKPNTNIKRNTEEIVWEYRVTDYGSTPDMLFRANRYPPDHPGIAKILMRSN